VSADTIVIAGDGVWFYVNAYCLAAASDNGFGALITGPAPPAMPISALEGSGVLNVVLHVMHGQPFAQFVPSFDELEAAVDALARYGAVRLAAGALLHDALLAHAPLRPLAVYALAGAYDLGALAIASSAHLHTLVLAAVSDADANRMGPVYLRRLFFLHLGRCDALKRLLSTGPAGHPSTPACNVAAQAAVTRAWALAAAYVSWAPRAGAHGPHGVFLLGVLIRYCRRAAERAVERILHARGGPRMPAVPGYASGPRQAASAAVVARQGDDIAVIRSCPPAPVSSLLSCLSFLLENVQYCSHPALQRRSPAFSLLYIWGLRFRISGTWLWNTLPPVSMYTLYHFVSPG
jgi:hypothetical protein